MLNILHRVWPSRVNGPGDRYVLWTQFCPLGCPGCFNPESWSDKVRSLISPGELAAEALSSGCSGVTISGGEPFAQPTALIEFLSLLQPAGELAPQLTDGVLIFTGLTLSEIEAADLSGIVSLADVCVSGRYVRNLRCTTGLRGSSNQEFLWNPTPGRGRSLIPEESVADQGVEVHTSGEAYVLTGFPELRGRAMRDAGIRIIHG